MTEEQKSKAMLFMAGQTKVVRSNIQRYLEDGNQVRFTKVTQDATHNQEYEINDCPEWKIWFSQLSHYHINQDIDDIETPVIKFCDGKSFSIREFSPEEFFENVRGKTFTVSIIPSFAAFDEQSTIWETLPDETFNDALEYVINCIENDKINLIGDIIRPARLYHLEEV